MRAFVTFSSLSDECATIFIEICRRYYPFASKHFEGSFQPILFSPATLATLLRLEQWQRVYVVLHDSLTRLRGVV